MGHHHTSRRSLIKAGVAGLTAIGMPSIVRAQSLKSSRPLSVLLDWVHNGPNSGFIVAKEKGFFADAGFDATMTQGKGSTTTCQLVASKVAQVGFADGFVVGGSVSKGMPLVMVGGVMRLNPTAIVVLEESGIKTPKDLEGKSLALIPGTTQTQQWPGFAKKAGLDISKVRPVNIDPAGGMRALLSGQVDAYAVYVSSVMGTLELVAKKNVKVFRYADHGVASVSNGIVVHRDMLSEPELVRAAVRASLSGFLYGRAHPDELGQIIKKNLESTDPQVEIRNAEWAWSCWVTPNTANKPLGWMADADWGSTVDLLKAYGGASETLEAKSLFTNEFVPTGAEFIPPQKV